MAVIIGSARGSEYGTSGWDGKAKAGDQTGKEVSTQAWYKHTKGWVVLRPKDPAKAEKIAYAMQAACDNERIGYDQSERDTLYNAAKKVGFDPAKVTEKVETDCSALVRVCCCYAGIDPGNIRTAGETEALVKTGAFEKLTASKYTTKSDYLKRGDILNTRTSGHTVVVLTDGALAYKYFKKPAIKTVSIVDALNSIGENWTFEYRKKIAAANNITNYKGTAIQNGTMLAKLYAGTLIKP